MFFLIEFFQEFENLFKSLIWEADSISFAQGMLEGIFADLKKLKPVEQGKSNEFRFSRISSLTDLNRSYAGTVLNESRDYAKTIVSRNFKKKVPNIKNLKIVYGNDTSDILKYYRRTIVDYIKDYLSHQSWIKNVHNTQALCNHFKNTFLTVKIFPLNFFIGFFLSLNFFGFLTF